jgi:DNA-binding NtrC family response regulator
MLDPQREILWLRRMRDLTHAVATEPELGKLLPRILDAAIELTEAERGFLVRVKGRRSDGSPKIKIAAARGFAREDLSSSSSVSRTVVQRVLEPPAEGLVTTREVDPSLFDAASLREGRILSILCAPMKLRGEIRGVLYLDHRFRDGAFTAQDLPILRAFADQAALAVETAELAPAASSAPPRTGDGLGRLLGAAPPMGALFAQLESAARSWDPVLILGESGSGKELVARELHERGSFPEAPFLTQNCGALEDGLLGCELFGVRRGAFTGAVADRPGLLVRAGKGTLLLDKLEDMSPTMQRQLLRVLEEHSVRPVGSAEAVRVDCRILATTSHDLRALVARGSFREDLYYRLDVLRIRVPALRERPSDIPFLVEHFLARAGGTLELTQAAWDTLQRYSWPGNVRELENEVRRLVSSGIDQASHLQLSSEIRAGQGVRTQSGKTLGDVERSLVEAALRDSGGNKSRAARQLGIPRTSLYGLLKRYGLS